MDKLINDYEPNRLMENNNLPLYSIYLEEVIKHFETHDISFLSLALDEEIRISLVFNRVEICRIVLQTIDQLSRKFGDDLFMNLGFFNHWAYIIQRDRLDFCQLFEQFDSIVPKINDTVDKHRPYMGNRIFYNPFYDPIDVKSPDHGCYHLIKSLKGLLYLADKFVFDYKLLFDRLTVMDPDLYNYIKEKINDHQYVIDHINQLFLIKDKDFRTRELVLLGLTNQDIANNFNNYHECLPIVEEINVTPNLSMRNKLLKNVITIDDDELMTALIVLLPLNMYYWVINQCVKSNSIHILRVVDNLLMDKLVSQYGLILPDNFKLNINTIISKIKNTDIFNYMFDKHKESITIDTYNTLMYEMSYINNLEIFRIVSKFGNNWGCSWYEATRCGNKPIIEYIQRIKNPPKGSSFQECLGKTIKKVIDDVQQ
jgi:hypothetical protein